MEVKNATGGFSFPKPEHGSEEVFFVKHRYSLLDSSQMQPIGGGIGAGNLVIESGPSFYLGK